MKKNWFYAVADTAVSETILECHLATLKNSFWFCFPISYNNLHVFLLTIFRVLSIILYIMLMDLIIVYSFVCFFSNYMTHWNSFNTISSFFHKYEFFHVSSNAVIDRASCHILSSWMVFHQYVFFHVSSNCVNRRASFHTLSRWMVFHQYEFFHASSKHSFWEFVLTPWTAEWFFNSMNSFMCHQIVWTAELLFTL